MNFMTHFFNLVECFDGKTNEGAINGRLAASDPNCKGKSRDFLTGENLEKLPDMVGFYC